MIHNPANLVNVTRQVNQTIANYYASIPASGFTGGQTVRQWLTNQSFAAQHQFGFDVLYRVLNGLPLP